MRTSSPFSSQKTRHHHPAQGLVEFALVLPLLLLIIFGLIEFARMMLIYSAVTSASRDAARYGAAAGDVGNQTPHYLDCVGIRLAARRLNFLAPITDNNVTISYDSGPGSANISSACPTTQSIQLGDRIVVRVTANFEPIVPILGLTAFPISSTTVRTILTSVEVQGTPPSGSAPVAIFSTENQTQPESAGTLEVRVQLSVPSAQNVSVPYVLSGSATPGTDFNASPNPVVIPAGSSSAVISVAITNDGRDEYDETIVLTMGTPTNATAGTPKVHTITVTDDDDPPVVNFLSSSQSIEESHSMSVQIQLSEESDKDVTVPFFVGGTASGGEGGDYTVDASPVVIRAGYLSVLVSIDVRDDSIDEDNETVILTLGEPTNATKGTPDVHTATILDDDLQPTAFFDLSSQSGPETLGKMEFKIMLSAASSRPIEVAYTVGGTAQNPADYTITASPAVFSPGVTEALITITLMEDGLTEGDETIVVTMGAATNATKGAPSVHTATITSNAVQPTLSFVGAGQTVDEDGEPLTIRVQLSNLWTSSVAVELNVTGSALLNNDYTTSDLILTIPSGSLYADLTFTPLDDVLDETAEQVTFSMTNIQNAIAGTQTTYGVTITDEDDQPYVAFTTEQQNTSEGGVSFLVTAELSGESGKDVSVPFTVGGTAAQNVDYTLAGSNPLVIEAGDLAASAVVTITNDTVFCEPIETIVFTMGQPANAAPGAVTEQTIEITDNDFGPTATSLTVEIGKGTRMYLDLSNINGGNSTWIKEITIYWNKHESAQKITGIKFINTSISSTNSSSSPSSYNWTSYNANLALAAQDVNKRLEILFNKTLAGSGADYSVDITFANGCYVRK